jgi:hypothetical protein
MSLQLILLVAIISTRAVFVVVLFLPFVVDVVVPFLLIDTFTLDSFDSILLVLDVFFASVPILPPSGTLLNDDTSPFTIFGLPFVGFLLPVAAATTALGASSRDDTLKPPY